MDTGRAVELWARDLTELDFPDDFKPLPYELRAAWGCREPGCGSIFAATKGGHIVEFQKNKEGKLEVSPALKAVGSLSPIQAGVYAMEGCPKCSVMRLGGGDGALYRLQGQRLEKLLQLPGEADKIRAIRFLSPNHSHILFVSVSGGLHLADASGKYEHIALPGTPRWLLSRGHYQQDSRVSDELETRWLVLSREGHVCEVHLDLSGTGRGGSSRLLGFLKESPLCTAGVVQNGRLNAVVYGTNHGVRLATLNSRGVQADRLIWRGPRVHYLRFCTLFQTRHLLICLSDQRILYRPWSAWEQAEASRWREWPVVDSETLAVQMTPDPEPGSDPSEINALLFLRDHRVAQMTLHNRLKVRECLRAAGEDLADQAPSGASPAEIDAWCFAEVTRGPVAITYERAMVLARVGGPKTQKVLVDRLTRFPLLAPLEVLEIGIEMLIAATRQGAPAIQALATRLHSQTLRYLRDASLSAESGSGHITLLKDWVGFLHKYYINGPTFSEKYLNLSALVTQNRERKTLDAFIYSARLAYQGFDVKRDWSVDSPIRVLATKLRVPVGGEDSPAVDFVAGVCDDGRFLKYRQIGEFTHPEFYPPSRDREASYDPGENPFGKLTRVLIVDEAGSWVIAPTWSKAHLEHIPRQKAESGTYEQLCESSIKRQAPNWSKKLEKLQKQQFEAQVYSMIALKPGRYLLGLRHIDYPLALFKPEEGEIKLFEQRWGTAEHIRSNLHGGLRRVRALAALSDNWVAVGAQDGHLRLVQITSDDQLLTDPKSIHIGSPIGVLHYEKLGDRELLFVGTEGDARSAELYCFEFSSGGFKGLSRPGEPRRLRLRFRDHIRYAVRALLVRPSPLKGHELLVVDGGGRITTFRLSRSAEDGKQRRFLSQRRRKLKVLGKVRCAVMLSPDHVALSGQDEQGQEKLRIIQIRPDPIHQSWYDLHLPETEGLDRALAEAQRYSLVNGEVQRGGRMTVEDGRTRTLALLATLPLSEPAVRVALFKARFDAACVKQELSGALLTQFRDEARESYPGDKSELKMILEVVQDHIRQVYAEQPDQQLEATDRRLEALSSLKAVFETFLPTLPGRKSLPDTTLWHKALVVRRLLTAQTLKLATPIQANKTDPLLNALHSQLRNWVEDMLSDAEEITRLETCRALGESMLHELMDRNAGQTSDMLFSSDDGKPPLAQAIWILRAITRYLYARPTEGRGAECDASTWAAATVVVALLRLMRGDELLIFDYLTVSRVEPHIFSVIKAQLTSEHDKRILTLLDLYNPFLSRVPTRENLHAHCERLELLKKGLAEDAFKGRNAEFLRVYLNRYTIIRAFINVQARTTASGKAFQAFSHLTNIIDDYRAQDREEMQDWMKELWTERTSFYQFTDAWIRDGVSRLPFQSEALSWELHEISESWELPFEPERTIATIIKAHWTSLLDGALPRVNDQYGAFVLVRQMNRSRHVFLARNVGNGDEAIIAIWTHHANKKLLKVWKSIEKLSKTVPTIPVIQDVAEKENIYMVMDRVGYKSLAQTWDFIKSQSRQKMKCVAFRCAWFIATAVRALHREEILHGDINLRNIIANKSYTRMWLVDFDHSHQLNEPDGAIADTTSRPHSPIHRYEGELQNKFIKQSREDGEDLTPLLKRDVMMLVREVLSLALAQTTHELGKKPLNKNHMALLGTKKSPMDEHDQWLSHLVRWWKKPRRKWDINTLIEILETHNPYRIQLKDALVQIFAGFNGSVVQQAVLVCLGPSAHQHLRIGISAFDLKEGAAECFLREPDRLDALYQQLRLHTVDPAKLEQKWKKTITPPLRRLQELLNPPQ